jgi:hypothetical protein
VRLHRPEVAITSRHRRAHRGEVDEQGHAGEVLEQNAPDDEGDLGQARRAGLPRRQRESVLIPDAPAVQMAQDRFE